MYAKVAFLIFTTSLLESFVFGNDSSSVLKNSIADWTKCCWDDYPANCLEKRTIRNVHDYNVVLRKELGLNEIATERSGKLLEEPPDKELQSLQTENQQILREIENKTGDLNNPRGLVEEVGDFVVYLAGKFFSSLIGGKGDDILDKQPESDESEAKEQVPQGKSFI